MESLSSDWLDRLKRVSRGGQRQNFKKFPKDFKRPTTPSQSPPPNLTAVIQRSPVYNTF